MDAMDDVISMLPSICYLSAITKRNQKEREHYIYLNFETCVEDIKILINMMDDGIFHELKQQLVQILPILEERTATWQEGINVCGKCDANVILRRLRLKMHLFQPDWSELCNNTGCVLTLVEN